ncbi:hypothetical protein BC936DRAFT_143521, partial [Jimgerdemannia flammicorona]
MNSFAWFCAFVLIAASMVNAISCPPGQYPTTGVVEIYPPIDPIPKNTCVAITCQFPGEAVSDGNIWWDKFTYKGVTGYASDSKFNTGPSNPTPGIPRCCFNTFRSTGSIKVYQKPDNSSKVT